jgi:4-hydroxy-tetrahydrodipicolinate synthase
MRLHAAWAAGVNAEAQAIAIATSRLEAALFAESNPVPLKHGLSLLGHMSGELRLPLCEASEATRAEIEAALRHLGLLSPEPPRVVAYRPAGPRALRRHAAG